MMDAQFRDAIGSTPPIISGGFHRGFGPSVARFLAMQEEGGERVMAVREDFSFNLHGVAKDSFDRKAAIVDLRANLGDDGAAPAVPVGVSRACAVFQNPTSRANRCVV